VALVDWTSGESTSYVPTYSYRAPFTVYTDNQIAQQTRRSSLPDVGKA